MFVAATLASCDLSLAIPLALNRPPTPFRACRFVGVLMDGEECVHRGADCKQTQGADIAALITSVVCDYHPASDEDTTMTLTEPNKVKEESVSFGRLWMAPDGFPLGLAPPASFTAARS